MVPGKSYSEAIVKFFPPPLHDPLPSLHACMEVASIGSFVGFITFPFVALSIGTLNEVDNMTIYELDHVSFSDIVSDGGKLEVRSKMGVVADDMGVVADRAGVEPLADVSMSTQTTYAVNMIWMVILSRHEQSESLPGPWTGFLCRLIMYAPICCAWSFFALCRS